MILRTKAMIAPSREQCERQDNDIFKREQENAARVESHHRRDDAHQIDSLRKLFRLTGLLYLCTDFDHRSKQRAGIHLFLRQDGTSRGHTATPSNP